MCWYCESTWPVVCQTRHGRHFNPTFTLLSLLLAQPYHNEHVCPPPPFAKMPMQQTFVLGPVYTKRQRQRCDDTCDFVLIETKESLQIGVTTHFQATPLFFNENRIVSVDAKTGLNWLMVPYIISGSAPLWTKVVAYPSTWVASKLTHTSVQILTPPPPQFPTIAYGWGTGWRVWTGVLRWDRFSLLNLYTWMDPKSWPWGM